MDDDVEDRVRQAVERFRPRLRAQALRLEIVEVAEGTAHLRLRSCGDAASLAPLLATLPQEIEATVMAAAPDLEGVVIEALHEPKPLAPDPGALRPPTLAAE